MLATHLVLAVKDKKRKCSIHCATSAVGQQLQAASLASVSQLEVCQRAKVGDVAQDVVSDIVATTRPEVKVQNSCCAVCCVQVLSLKKKKTQNDAF